MAGYFGDYEGLLGVTEGDARSSEYSSATEGLGDHYLGGLERRPKV